MEHEFWTSYHCPSRVVGVRGPRVSAVDSFTGAQFSRLLEVSKVSLVLC